jgi:hypothetical protein
MHNSRAETDCIWILGMMQKLVEIDGHDRWTPKN